MDGEFEKVKASLPPVECNTTAAKEHVSEAERTIRTLKECTKGLIGTLPFQYISQRMKIEFIYRSGEEWSDKHILTKRTPGEVENGLYQALHGAAWQLLQGT